MKEDFVRHRGIENLAGENNCFVNVVIQTLWHVDAFRVSMMQMLPESTIEYNQQHENLRNWMNKSEEVNLSLLSTVCTIFSEYMYDEKNMILNPNKLRETLWLVSGKFKLGEIADSNEAFDTILQQLHDEHRNCQVNMEYRCLSHRYQYILYIDIYLKRKF